MGTTVLFCIVLAIGFAGLVAWLGYLFLIRHDDRIETYQTQIPLVLGTLAAVLYCTFSSLVGVLFLLEGYSPPIRWSFLVGGGILFFPLAAAIWAYGFTVPYLKRKLHWQIALNTSINQAIQEIASTLGLSHVPRTVFSDQITLPCVLGRRSQTALLVLPSWWNTNTGQTLQEPSIRFQLYHELAHLKNRDVGFTTWAFSFILGLVPGWFLSCLFLLGVGFDTYHYSQAVGLIPILITTNGLVLGILYFVVLRHRELDADARAIEALEKEGIKGLEGLLKDSASLGPAQSRKNKDGYIRSWIWRLELLMTDRVYFGKHKRFWKILHQALSYVLHSHPLLSERISHIQARKSDTGWQLPSLSWAVWTGLVVSLFTQSGVLGTGVLSLILSDITGMDSGKVFNQYLFHFWLVVGLPLAGLATAFSALMPSRFSDEVSALPVDYLKRLGLWMGVAVISAMLLNLTLFPLWLYLDLMAVGAIGVGFLITVAMGLFSTSRYVFDAFNLKDTLLSNLYHLPVLLLFLFVGVWVFIFSRSFTATGLYLAGILLGGLFWGRLDGRLSWRDGYVKGFLWRKLVIVERPGFDRWGWLWVCLIEFVGFFVPAFLVAGVFLAIYALSLSDLNMKNPNSIDGPIAILILITSVVVAAVKLNFRAPQKISSPIFGSIAMHINILQRFFPEALPIWKEPLKKFLAVVESTPYNHSIGSIDLSDLDMRTNLCRCLAVIENSELMEQSIRQWILSCECPEGGFGLWPGAKPQLSKTYVTLQFLSECKALHLVDKDKHVRWLISCQQADGSFNDHQTRYSLWTNAFFGLRSLVFLNAAPRYPITSQMQSCLERGFHIALRRPDPETVYRTYWCLQYTGKIPSYLENEMIQWCKITFPSLFKRRTRRVVDQYLAFLCLTDICPSVAAGIELYQKKILCVVAESLKASLPDEQ